MRSGRQIRGISERTDENCNEQNDGVCRRIKRKTNNEYESTSQQIKRKTSKTGDKLYEISKNKGDLHVETNTNVSSIKNTDIEGPECSKYNSKKRITKSASDKKNKRRFGKDIKNVVMKSTPQQVEIKKGASEIKEPVDEMANFSITSIKSVDKVLLTTSTPVVLLHRLEPGCHANRLGRFPVTQHPPDFPELLSPVVSERQKRIITKPASEGKCVFTFEDETEKKEKVDIKKKTNARSKNTIKKNIKKDGEGQKVEGSLKGSCVKNTDLLENVAAVRKRNPVKQRVQKSRTETVVEKVLPTENMEEESNSSGKHSKSFHLFDVETTPEPEVVKKGVKPRKERNISKANHLSPRRRIYKRSGKPGKEAELPEDMKMKMEEMDDIFENYSLIIE